MAPPDTHYAIVGHRIGFRLAYLSAALRVQRATTPIFRLDGAPVKVRYDSVTIHDVINDTPNTCTLTIDAATPPTAGQRLTVALGADTPRPLFAGPLQTVDLTYEGRPAHTVYPCQAIDDTPLANRKLPYGYWTNVSATDIAYYLVFYFCPPGFSGAGVQANLPPVTVNFDSTEGMDGCLRQLAKLIGGYFYWEEKTLHLFLTESSNLPAPIDAAHPFLNDPPIAVSTDTSQIRTRTYGKGYAEQTIADVAGTDTIIPITNAVMFNPAGGLAVTETQRLRYTGTTPGGGGTVIGPGIGPAAALQATITTGAGVPLGTHDYAVTFKTAAGESLIGPRVTVNIAGSIPPPGALTTGAQGSGPAGPDVGTHQYAVTLVTAAGETTPSPVAYATAAGMSQPNNNVAVYDFDPGNQAISGRGIHPGDTLIFYYSYSGAAVHTDLTKESALSMPSAPYTVKPSIYLPGPNTYGDFQFSLYFSPDVAVKWVRLWISVNGGPLRCENSTNNLPATYSQFYQFSSHSTSWPFTYVGAASVSRGPIPLSAIPVGPAGVTARKLYRTAAGAAQLRLLTTLGDNTTTIFSDTIADAALGANAPTANTTTAAQVMLTGIPIGGPTVTGRRVYRSAANTSALKLLFDFTGDNTTTAYADVYADTALTTPAPTSDTSGLQQPAGTVLAGAASIIVAGAAWASPLGGWAIIGNGQQTIRYTGLSGNSLTGIPATGPGAITATVTYNSTITAAPALLGVTGLTRALIKGAPINLWIQLDDLGAQADLAARDGTDGIIEHLITDERRGEASLRQLCAADLELYRHPIQTVRYATRDLNTKSGKPVAVNLATPPIVATLTIQDVTITEIGVAPGLPPKFTATASSIRFSLDDILRRLGAALDVTS